MKTFQLKHRHGFLKITCIVIFLMIPGALCAATYYSDTDGDGITETITTTSTSIEIYHPSTGSTSVYSYDYFSYTTFFSISAIADTDGLLGNEIVVTWWECIPSLCGMSQGTVAQGIDVIVDRTGSTHRYSYYNVGNITNYSISAVADTDGLLGKEIIVTWQECSPTLGCSGSGIFSQAIDVIVDRTGSTHRYYYYNVGNITNYSISAVADTNMLPGKEIIVTWQECSPTLGCSGSGIFSQAIDVIHDATSSTSRYAQGQSTSVQRVRDYDKIAGAEICYYNYTTSGYELITDRTQGTTTVTTCTNTDPAQPPIVAITPPTGSSNAGTAKKFKAVYSDANGTADINKTIMALRANSNSWANAIYVKYVRAENNLYLLDNAGTTFLGPCTPGSSNTISNSQGTLNCAQTSVSIDGNDLRVDWSITPKTTYKGIKKIYLKAVDNEGLSSGLIQVSTWTIN